MIQTSDPTAYLADGAFAHLSDKDKVSIVSLLARASERAYRRGAHQGAHIWRRGLRTCRPASPVGASGRPSPHRHGSTAASTARHRTIA
jgi:hypothetical protein